MAAKPLTKAEAAWLKKLQEVLDECPSSRLEAYTIGDPSITIFDKGYSTLINKMTDDGSTDFCTATADLGANIGSLRMPFPVHSTAG